VYDWFQRFQDGNESLDDLPRSGRPLELDDDGLRALVESNPRLTTREMAASLGCAQKTVVNHLSKIGKVPKLGTWVPHQLSDCDRQQRVDLCMFHLTSHRTTAWLDSIITGDEKWVAYVNHRRKHQWVDKGEKPEPEPKPEIHKKQIMLSVWWDSKGVVWFELLPPHTTITAAYYSNQLQRLNAQIAIKRPRHGKVRFLHDNARPHVAKVTRAKLVELGWEVLPHPAYSPDLAPSDYHLFRELHHHLEDKEFDDEDEIQLDLSTFFESQPTDFWHKGIHSLPDRWQLVIGCDGDYIVD
jgi:histone-lysine N-methyltransferase SETMAR